MKHTISTLIAGGFLAACSNAAQSPAAPAAEAGPQAGMQSTPAATTSVAGVSGAAPAAASSSAGRGSGAAVGGVSTAAGAPASAGTPAQASAGAGAGDAGEAGDAEVSSSAGAGGSTSGAATGPFPSVSDFTGDGPFHATTLTSTGPNNNYTVYMPMELAPNGVKNPIVGWMSGGATTPDLYPLLPHLATHGFVVVASNTAPGIGDEATLGQEILAGISWAIAENERADSQLFGKLDTTKIASMGYSMGSLATFTIANDPRLTTTVHISGGTMAHDQVKNLHAPAVFLCGIPGDDSCNILSTDCDIAAANCDVDFMSATTPVTYGNFKGGHLGILTDPLSTQIQTEVTAWLRWQLMSDSTLESRFVGPDCGMCKDMNWKVQQKNWP